ncbi:hypothetical protein B4098_0217 [Heyndrickxia coagulans]|jgi:hypothetical protein|uniref:Uncharacterized protein n=1 Tax=Heyndrickxia coagulans TaxID=1398 RepID=A0A150KGZ3_HEYCO|nr:hypothetical protein B4098_0217 [Heyndrickxia coagulans]KYC69674.1 hypothetical protein B4099_0303 [Heyndrickxia coagulans]
MYIVSFSFFPLFLPSGFCHSAFFELGFGGPHIKTPDVLFCGKMKGNPV